MSKNNSKMVQTLYLGSSFCSVGLTLFIPNTHRCVVTASYQIRIGAYLPTCPPMPPCFGHIE